MSKVIGIDLGTTFSAIAELDDLGNPEVLSDPESGDRITRSAVYFGKEKVIVGEKAKDAAVTKRDKVVFEVKSQMENEVIYSLKDGKFIENNGKLKGYTPSQISSLILSKLGGYTSKVKKAVITVPAQFADRARGATIEAAKLSKLDVELINEPTAAILHYANMPNVSLNGRVMVFDLGGGTFDISIAKVIGKKVDILTSTGDKHLGGQDFDREIINILDKKYKKSKGKGIDQNDPVMLDIAERIKKLLSTKEKVSEIIEGPKGPAKIDVTRKEFENSIDTFLEKIKMLMEEALDRSKLKPISISQILLVGGSTRIPIIAEIIKKIMKKSPTKGVNVDEAVACGAAIYAGLQSKGDLNSAQKKAISKVEMTDICPHNLGTIIAAVDQERNQAVKINSIIIPRDTKLPASITKEYAVLYDGQESIKCTVTQSEEPEEDIEFVVIIGEEELALAKNAKAGEKIEVTYSYDLSGKVHCIFEETKSGKKRELSLKPEGSKTIKDLKENLDFDIE